MGGMERQRGHPSRTLMGGGRRPDRKAVGDDFAGKSGLVVKAGIGKQKTAKRCNIDLRACLSLLNGSRRDIRVDPNGDLYGARKEEFVVA